MTDARRSSHVASLSDALSIRYNNRVYDLQASGKDVIVLSLGEAFFDLPLAGVEDLERPGVFHYTHTRGLPELRECISALYARRYGVSVSAEEEVLTTAGSKLAVYMALASVVDVGSEVIIQEPAWVSYSEQIRLCHGKPISVPWDKTADDLAEFCTEATRAIIVNNPNNPSGRLLSRQEWESIYSLARERGLFIIADEAYSDFVTSPTDFVSAGLVDPSLDNTIICNSLSKNLGISGWRLGYLLASRESMSPILKLNQHLVTCAPSLSAFYVARHFTELSEAAAPQIRAVLELRSRAATVLERLGVAFMAGESTFYLFVSIADSNLSSMEFCERLLEEQHVATVPGLGYGESCDDFIRVSIGTEPFERIELGFEAIQELIDETRGR